MEKIPALDLEIVHEFVSKAHSELDPLKELLTGKRALVNATWDWGGGDFETALGAASHMGRKDIANFLLKNGARLDIFAAAMLGKLEIVKAALTTYPNLLNTPGPHGISLITHAEMGGQDAEEVLKYLNILKNA